MWYSNSISRLQMALVLVSASVFPAFVPVAHAALTDIAAEPVITKPTISAKPNLMFVLDESGSMARDYMPDEMSGTSTYGFLSAQCNGVAYDPTLVYLPAKDSLGNDYPNSSFTSAKNNGYSGTSTTNLNNRSYYVYTGSQKKMGWTYDSSGNEDINTTFYKECNSVVGNTPGNLKFTQVTVTTAAPEAQNYANWYTYYRTRSLLMRTAVGRAVQKLGEGYRVGFSRINSTAITDGVDFRDTKVFNAAQKLNFYNSLYSAEPGGGTPLRGALSKIGRYFANKASGQTYDPVEYSCQRNYALLSTDGYWNSGGFPGISEGASYGPYGVTGSAIGNQDATEVRPMYDGGNSVKTAETPTTTITRRQVITTNSTTTTSRRNFVEINSSGCSSNRYNQWVTPETRVQTTSTKTTSIVKETTTTTRTVVITNGTVTSDTTSSPSTTTVTESPGTPVAQTPTDTNWQAGTRQKTASCLKSNQVDSPGYGATTTSTSNASPSQASTVLSVEGPTQGQETTTTSTSGGTSDTLSDLAQYYFVTDLRSPALGNCTSSTSGQSRDVCENAVPIAGRDNLRSQHMTTFTLGLGTSGTLAFDKDYLKQTAGDYVALTNGTKNWPPTTTSLSGNSGDARNIDDLWHAAVNGRGQYYSAMDANGLSDAIAGVINSIQEAEGAGAASSFNTLAFVSGNSNQIFQAGYTTNAWTGEITSYPVDGNTGDVGTTANWSAQALLDQQLWTNRKIYYRQPSGASTLRQFKFTNLNGDGYGSWFANFCLQTPQPGQCNAYTAANRTAANDGNNLVDYLIGDRSKNQNTATPLYRTRNHILGDIINGAPIYVGKPPFNYTDAGYASFVAANSSRAPMIYAGANDGMLHAFSATTGVEMWAYVPTAVMSKMFRLADTDYPTSHESFVDAEPVIGDIYYGGSWKTVLIGGLGLGGKAYYALDVTDPANPKSLWEFSDTNLGLTFGNPIITKRADGTWIVAFSSGYNNADGKGHLYILNAGTGTKLLDIVTPAGSPGTPSGLGKINAWIDLSTNNTALRFYGGDLLGNLWRFDFDNKVLPYQSAFLLAQLQTPSGLPQPVTIKPETMLISKTHPVVVIGTGRYLGDSDISNVEQQSIYIIKDSLNATGLGVLRSNPKLVKRTVTVSGSSAIGSTETISWDTNDGWWFDLPNTAERIVNSMSLLSGTLFVPSAVPSGDACVSGGSSWLYQIDIVSGLSVNPIGTLFSNSALIVGLTSTTTADGSGLMYVRDSKRGLTRRPTGKATPVGVGDPRRTSWRELIN